MLKLINRTEYTYSVPWNLWLITSGCVIFALSIKAIALPQQFISGGLFGSALLLFYAADVLSPGWLYLLLNLPLFTLAWRFISKRFVYYSLYAMIITGLAYEMIQVDFGIKDQLYAAVACGVLSGAGAGIVLRSLGSNGGLDVVAVYLFQKFNIGIGRVYFAFNLVLFSLTLFFLEIDLVIASLILVFISSVIVEYTLSLFNQRKLAFIVSDRAEKISKTILDSLEQGATFLKGRGAYTGRNKEIVLTVVNNIQLKRLEEIVFTIDPDALFIVENTFAVLGASFSRRKIY